MKFLLPVLIFALLTSCQKGIEDIDLPQRTTQVDGILISQYVELDTTVGVKADTVRKWLFFYDNLKRISGFETYGYRNGTVDPFGIEKRIFYYNSSDTLPYKRLIISGSDTLVTYHNFVNGRLLSDSSIGRTGSITSIDIDRYSYYPNKIVDTFWTNITNASSLSKNYATYTFNKVNDLTISQRDTLVYDYDKPGPWRQDVGDQSYSYDTYHNPFYVLHKLYLPVCERVGQPTITGIERCNVVEAKTAILYPPPVSDDHIRYEYQYNSDGYPTAVRISDVKNPAVVRKGLYFYIK